MQFQKYVIVTAIIMSLVGPNDAWGFIRKAIRVFKNPVKTLVDKVVAPIVEKIPLCKIAFEVGCPAAVAAGSAAIVAGSSGSAAPIAVAAGTVVATKGCGLAKDQFCKRSVMDDDTILIPFSDNFDNYDYNGDKMIEYHEFMQAVTASVGLIHPDELMEPFVFADVDGNDMIDTDEFLGAPFVFGQLTAGDILTMAAMKSGKDDNITSI